MAGLAIGAEDVRSAAAQIRGAAVRTPLLENAALNDRAGRRVLIKFEGAQHTGSFKFRGAYNRLSRHGKAPHRDDAITVVISGANVDPADYAAIIRGT